VKTYTATIRSMDSHPSSGIATIRLGRRTIPCDAGMTMRSLICMFPDGSCVGQRIRYQLDAYGALAAIGPIA
jgi:hypothetical protein